VVEVLWLARITILTHSWLPEGAVAYQVIAPELLMPRPAQQAIMPPGLTNLVKRAPAGLVAMEGVLEVSDGAVVVVEDSVAPEQHPAVVVKVDSAI